MIKGFPILVSKLAINRRGMKMEPYYLVWNPKGNFVRHQSSTFTEAQAEAERLANLDKGQTFVVLTSVGGAVSNGIQRLGFEHALVQLPTGE